MDFDLTKALEQAKLQMWRDKTGLQDKALEQYLTGVQQLLKLTGLSSPKKD